MNQDFFWIWLNENESISLTNKKALLQKYETPKAIFKSVNGEFSDITLLDKVKKIHELNQKHNIKIFTLFEMIKHKSTLNHLPWPILFYYKGNLNLNKSVALIGTRKMSMHGYYYTEQLCEMLAHSDKVINTGLSDGVEKKTVEYCLENNYHVTAFVAHGLHECTPKSKSSLMDKLAIRGAIISPYSSMS